MVKEQNEVLGTTETRGRSLVFAKQRVSIMAYLIRQLRNDGTTAEFIFEATDIQEVVRYSEKQLAKPDCKEITIYRTEAVVCLARHN